MDIELVNTIFRTRYCPSCQVHFARRENLDYHLQTFHPRIYQQQYGTQQGQGLEEFSTRLDLASAIYNDVCSVYKVNLSDHIFLNTTTLFNCLEQQINRALEEELRKKKNVKVFLRLQYLFRKDGAEESDLFTKWISSFSHTVLHAGDIPFVLETILAKLNNRVETFMEGGSGLIVEDIPQFEMIVCTYPAISGGTYMQLPYLIKNKTGLLNIDNSREAFVKDVCRYKREGDTLKCFLWCVAAADMIHMRGDSGDNKSMRKYRNYVRTNAARFDLDGLEFPLTINQVRKFESQNPHFKINVFGYNNSNCEKETEADYPMPELTNPDYNSLKKKRWTKMNNRIRNNLSPLYITKNTNPEATDVDLMLIHHGIDGDPTEHYVLIKDINVFLRSDNNGRYQYCKYCLNCFSTPQTLEVHVEKCAALGIQKTSFPDPNTKLKFDRYWHMVKHDYVIYADYESFIVKKDDSSIPRMAKVTDQRKFRFQEIKAASNTNFISEHKLCGYSWVLLHNGVVEEHKTYHATEDGEDIMARFWADIIPLCEELQDRIKKDNKENGGVENMIFPMDSNPAGVFDDWEEQHPGVPRPIVRGAGAEEEILDSGDCYFCGEPLISDPNSVDAATYKAKRTVRHHDHATNLFTGLSHNDCNLTGRRPTKIPLFMHNMAKYDARFIVQSLNHPLIKETKVVPLSSETFVSITINNCINILDSFRFLGASIQTLTSQLAKESTDKFHVTRQLFEKVYPGSREHLGLLKQKGFYPYEKISCAKDFDATRLPPAQDFYSELTEETISADDHAHAQNVWDKFGCRTMGDYHDLYVTSDVGLLADVFENFRNVFLQKFQIDPAHCLSLPMLSWEAALKHSRIKLDYLTDPDMYIFFENSIRGGFCGSGSIRYSEAKNRYLKNFNPETDEAEKYIMYWDFNSLYPASMDKKLPVRNFKWVPQEELATFTPDKIFNHPDEDDVGYFFEVDLSIPAEKHDYLNDYPLAPFSRLVSPDETSEFQKMEFDDLELPQSTHKSKKLIADLNKKTNYICHYTVLKKYMELGARLDKVHRAVQFEQENWLRDFLDWCTEQRRNATSDFEKQLYKQISNAIYGKQIEDKRKRRNVKIITCAERALYYLKKATLEDVIPISDKILLFVMKREQVTLDKPIYSGATVLDKAKELMYDFYYNYLRRMYGDDVKLIFTDTDSLGVEITNRDMTTDPYKDMLKHRQLFDLSDYKQDDPELGFMHSDENKKVRGKMKDVSSPEGLITHFCFLKPKMYSYLTNRMKTELRAKGLSTKYLRRTHQFADYFRTLKYGGRTTLRMKQIVSLRHRLYTAELTKKGLNRYDNKRYSVNNIDSLAYGHYRLPRLL